MRRLIRGERGATAVEFALIVPVLLGIVAFVVVAGLRLVYVGLAENEARSMARAASIRSAPSVAYGDATAAGRLTLCNAGTMVLAGADYVASADCVFQDFKKSSTAGEGDIVKVTLTYRITSIQGLLSWLPTGVVNGLTNITASASMVRE
jgi:Flp pilus assembly protein TadG